MAEGIFSIFPDAQADIGDNGLKDGPRNSRKQALRDVKNTLQPKHAAGKPVGKLNSGNAVVPPACNTPAKELGVSPAPKQASKEAFQIRCDSVDKLSWDYCDCKKEFEDEWFAIQSPSECLQEKDINYLIKGVLGTFVHDFPVPEDDDELCFLPPRDPDLQLGPLPVIWVPDDVSYTEIPLSDEEE